MKIKEYINLINLRKYIIGFLIGLSFIIGVTYASTDTIGGLFEKISGNWKLVGTNIKDGTVGNQQLGDNSITTSKIVDKNVTQAKLSDDIVAKLNAPIVTETDPTAVKLDGDEIIGGLKTFTNPVFGVTPTNDNHLVTKQYVDNSLNSVFGCSFNGTTLPNGSSVTAYLESSVPYGNSCTSQTRTCTNGILSGTYTYSSCGVLYTYAWDSLSWGACSEICGGGTQTRVVSCKRSDGITVDDSNCSGLKPINNQSCNLNACIEIIYKDSSFNEIGRVDNSGNKISGNPENLTCSGHITIGSYTIQACNLGTNTVGSTNNSLSYGNYYQFGKSNTSWNFGNSSYLNDWKSPGGVDGGSANDWGIIDSLKDTATFANSSSSNQIKMRGPCPVGYHVPTSREWQDIITTWLGGNSSSTFKGTKFSNSLKIPIAGYRLGSDSSTTYDQGSYVYYWTSSPKNNYGYVLFFDNQDYTLVTSNTVFNRSNASPIRCMLSPYTYSWSTAAWGACSLTCGGGTQTRNVTCQRSDGITVSDSNCTGLKPINSQNCNTQACCTTTDYEPYRVESNCYIVNPNGISWPGCMTSRYCDNDFVYPYYNSCTGYGEGHTYTYGQFVGCY